MIHKSCMYVCVRLRSGCTFTALAGRQRVYINATHNVHSRISDSHFSHLDFDEWCFTVFRFWLIASTVSRYEFSCSPAPDRTLPQTVSMRLQSTSSVSYIRRKYTYCRVSTFVHILNVCWCIGSGRIYKTITRFSSHLFWQSFITTKSRANRK